MREFTVSCQLGAGLGYPVKCLGIPLPSLFDEAHFLEALYIVITIATHRHCNSATMILIFVFRSILTIIMTIASSLSQSSDVSAVSTQRRFGHSSSCWSSLLCDNKFSHQKQTSTLAHESECAVAARRTTTNSPEEG